VSAVPTAGQAAGGEQQNAPPSRGALMTNPELR